MSKRIAWTLVTLLISMASAFGKAIRFESVEPKAGDRPFVEFRSREKISPLDQGHVFVVVGRERNSRVYYTNAIGFYPVDDGSVKSVLHGPGHVSFDIDRPSVTDKVFRAYVTEDQARRAMFAAKHISTTGKTYSLPFATCVDFARDIASVISLDTGPGVPPMAGDPLLPFDPFNRTAITPDTFIDDLRRNNSSDAPLVASRKHYEVRNSEVGARRAWETNILRKTPVRGPGYNPRGEDMRDQMQPPGVGVALPFPESSSNQPNATITPIIPK